MTLWTIERLRLTRTSRGLVLLGVYLLFGVIGPLTARYLEEILGSVGGGLSIDVPTPTAADGITQFTSNAGQLGLLAVVVVAAGALAVDADREHAIFLRTRVRNGWQLLLPRVVVPATAAAVALVLGTAVAVALTQVLLGAVPFGPVLVGTLYGVLYLVFVVALTAAVSTTTRSVVATVLATVSVLLVLPVLGLVPAIAGWVPSELLGAIDVLVRGGAVGDAAPAAAVAAVGAVALVAVAVRRTERREV